MKDYANDAAGKDLREKLQGEINRLRRIRGPWTEENAAECMRLIAQYPEETVEEYEVYRLIGSAAYNKMARLIHEGKIEWP